MRASGSAQVAVRLTFEFLVLAATRSGKVRFPTWDELDRDGLGWTLKQTRGKAQARCPVALARRTANAAPPGLEATTVTCVRFCSGAYRIPSTIVITTECKRKTLDRL